MYTIKQPNQIIFGKYSARDFDFPNDSLVITSRGAKSRGWLDYTSLENCLCFDMVESNPSMETVEKIISEFNKPSLEQDSIKKSQSSSKNKVKSKKISKK